MNLYPKKNKGFILYILLFSCIMVSGQNFDKILLDIPEHYIPLLSKQNRFELIEYYKANQKDSVKNKFGNFATLELYDSTNQHIILKPSKISRVEIKKLNTQTQNPILAIINTILQPVPHSSINFYNMQWQRISVDFALPKATDWVKKETADNDEIDMVWISKILNNNLVTLKFEKEKIVAQNNSLESMGLEDKKRIVDYLENSEMIYAFDSKSWFSRFK